MFKKILVATDGSRYSCHALSTALALARTYGAEIRLLHVVVEPRSYGMYGTGNENELTEEQLNKIGDEIFSKTLKGQDTDQVTINRKVIVGRPSLQIINEIKEQDIDLLVLGERGFAPFLGAFVGSVALRVLAEATCPVLVVK